MYSRLLYILGDTGDEAVPVLEVGVEVRLVHHGARLGLYAGLLVRQGELVQHVDVREGVAQGDLVGGHLAGQLILREARHGTEAGRLSGSR